MKRLLILLLTGLFAQLVVSCYPEGADNIDDYDVAITNYDKSADFSAFTTFSKFQQSKGVLDQDQGFRIQQDCKS